jgi:hypothetical protein
MSSGFEDARRLLPADRAFAAERGKCDANERGGETLGDATLDGGADLDVISGRGRCITDNGDGDSEDDDDTGAVAAPP